jgi:hypothetical protein
MKIPRECFEHIFGKPVGKAGIPKEYLEFAEKSHKGSFNYCSANENLSGYYTQWLEDDAFEAAGKMSKLFGFVQ